MGVNSLPKTVTRQRRDCDLSLGPSAPESSTLTTRLPSQPRSEVEKMLLEVEGGTRSTRSTPVAAGDANGHTV